MQRRIYSNGFEKRIISIDHIEHALISQWINERVMHVSALSGQIFPQLIALGMTGKHGVIRLNRARMLAILSNEESLFRRMNSHTLVRSPLQYWERVFLGFMQTMALFKRLETIYVCPVPDRAIDAAISDFGMRGVRVIGTENAHEAAARAAGVSFSWMWKHRQILDA